MHLQQQIDPLSNEKIRRNCLVNQNGFILRLHQISLFLSQHITSWFSLNQTEGPHCISGVSMKLLRTKLELSRVLSVSTCFLGIPSDKILFPSERGDKSSFFQYMNPCSLTAYSVSKLGAWNQEKARRWASKLEPSVCMGSGVMGAPFCFWREMLCVCAWRSAAVTHHCSYGALQRRGVVGAPRRALFRTEIVPFPVSHSLHFIEGVWLQEVNEMKGLAAFTPRLHRCREAAGLLVDGSAENQSAVKVCAALACLIVKEGGGWERVSYAWEGWTHFGAVMTETYSNSAVECVISQTFIAAARGKNVNYSYSYNCHLLATGHIQWLYRL